MKYFLIGLVKVYQLIPGPWHNRCRYSPTCSDYSIIALERFGAFKGSYLTVKRLLRCNPFSKGGFDPVPEKKV